jgi:ribokinase
VYPDGGGGNMTTADSACSAVQAGTVESARSEFERLGARGIALAVPEVPVGTRAALIGLGSEHGLLCAASFISREIRPAMDRGLLAAVDLLAINLDEASALAGREPGGSPGSVADAAIGVLAEANPRMMISITAGDRGSWSWDGEEVAHVSKASVQATSTAGAGDAHFAGILAGLAAGLKLREAQELATLVAGLAVTSPHTINKQIDQASLLALAEANSALVSRPVRSILEAA